MVGQKWAKIGMLTNTGSSAFQPTAQLTIYQELRLHAGPVRMALIYCHEYSLSL